MDRNTPISNWDKQLVLNLLIKERQQICDHANKIMSTEGIDLRNWRSSECGRIGRIIDQLDLKTRNHNELAEQIEAQDLLAKAKGGV